MLKRFFVVLCAILIASIMPSMSAEAKAKIDVNVEYTYASIIEGYSAYSDVTIDSSKKIKKVTVSIKDEEGEVITKFTEKPNAKSTTIDIEAQEKSLKMEELKPGTYTYNISVKLDGAKKTVKAYTYEFKVFSKTKARKLQDKFREPIKNTLEELGYHIGIGSSSMDENKTVYWNFSSPLYDKPEGVKDVRFGTVRFESSIDIYNGEIYISLPLDTSVKNVKKAIRNALKK